VLADVEHEPDGVKLINADSFGTIFIQQLEASA